MHQNAALCGNGLNKSYYWYYLFLKKRIVNSLPYDKILDWSKLRAIAEDKMNVIHVMKDISELVENIVRKTKKMLVTNIFSSSHNVFKSLICQGC